MNISMGVSSSYTAMTGMNNQDSKTEELKNKLRSGANTEDEMMEACKGFEAYMLEQVMKSMRKMAESDEDKNDYLEQFGDLLYEEYAKEATKDKGLGIAQMLYEAMKRNVADS